MYRRRVPGNDRHAQLRLGVKEVGSRRKQKGDPGFGRWNGDMCVVGHAPIQLAPLHCSTPAHSRGGKGKGRHRGQYWVCPLHDDVVAHEEKPPPPKTAREKGVSVFAPVVLSLPLSVSVSPSSLVGSINRKGRVSSH